MSERRFKEGHPEAVWVGSAYLAVNVSRDSRGGGPDLWVVSRFNRQGYIVSSYPSFYDDKDDAIRAMRVVARKELAMAIENAEKTVAEKSTEIVLKKDTTDKELDEAETKFVDAQKRLERLKAELAKVADVSDSTPDDGFIPDGI